MNLCTLSARDVIINSFHFKINFSDVYFILYSTLNVKDEKKAYCAQNMMGNESST